MTKESLGTQRHPNDAPDPAKPTLRVLICVRCGDRHTVDVSSVLAEAAIDVERLAKAMDQAGLDGETTPFPLRVLADLVAAEYERLGKP